MSHCDYDFDDESVNDRSDYLAEMEQNEESYDEMTDEEREEFEADQAAAAWIDAEKKAERALEFGYGS